MNESKNVQVLILSNTPVMICSVSTELSLFGIEHTVFHDSNDNITAKLLVLDINHYLNSSIKLPKSDYTIGIICQNNSIQSGTIPSDVINSCNIILPYPFLLKDFHQAIKEFCFEGCIASDISSVGYNLPILCDNGRSVVYNGVNIYLSPNEMILFNELSSNEGIPISRERLATLLGGASSNKVDVHICSMRKKFEGISQRKIIHSVRGIGYMLK